MASIKFAELTDADIKEDIAKRITYWRIQAQMSKADLAKRAGKQRSDIGRWESGDVTPGITAVFRIATACGVSLAIFLTADLPESKVDL